jgi:hypothetical protein
MTLENIIPTTPDNKKEVDILCSVCYEEFSTSSLKTLTCEHKFHEKCIDT